MPSILMGARMRGRSVPERASGHPPRSGQWERLRSVKEKQGGLLPAEKEVEHYQTNEYPDGNLNPGEATLDLGQPALNTVASRRASFRVAVELRFVGPQNHELPGDRLGIKLAVPVTRKRAVEVCVTARKGGGVLVLALLKCVRVAGTKNCRVPIAE